MLRHSYYWLLLVLSGPAFTQIDTLPPAIGVAHQLELDSLHAAADFACLTENTQKLFSPLAVTEPEFAAYLAEIRRLRVPLFATNLFLPATLKVVGPETDEAALLAYVEVVFRRARSAGVTLITWGSCGSRRLPEGFDPVTATAQFVRTARQVAEVAARYGILLALENLNTTECNFITSLTAALAVVRAVDHDHFRLCVDLYHMLVDGEPATAIAGTGPYAVYCELAEREDRAPPGVHGDDFTPYFRALRAEGYAGKLVIECRWDDYARQAPAAVAALQKQLHGVYRQ